MTKVGDQLAFREFDEYQIETVEKITPSGRIVCGRYVLNPDLTIRGRRGGYCSAYCGEKVTDEILWEVERKEILRILKTTNLHKLTLEKLRIIRDAIS